MAHPQNSPRGLFVKKALTIPASGGLKFTDYSASNNLLTADANGLIVRGGVKISNAKLLTANSTAILIPTVSTKPATRQLGGIAFVSNSTGKMLAYHSTGTTWVYASKTSVLA